MWEKDPVWTLRIREGHKSRSIQPALILNIIKTPVKMGLKYELIA